MIAPPDPDREFVGYPVPEMRQSRRRAMLLEVDREQIGVLRRALEARVRDMYQRLGNEPGDEGYRREAQIATQLLRRVEGLERDAGHRTWSAADGEFYPGED
jgi:hypothetical protein